MCLKTSNDRISQGYDNLIANLRKPASQSPKIEPSTIHRLLHPGESWTQVASSHQPPLSSCSSYHSITSASQISFPGIEGKLASRVSFNPVTGSPTCALRSSRTLPLLERQVSKQEVVDARWLPTKTDKFSTAPLRPSLRAAIEQNSELQTRFMNGAWRHRVSRTPRSEVFARAR